MNIRYIDGTVIYEKRDVHHVIKMYSNLGEVKMLRTHIAFWKELGYDSLRLDALYDIVKDYALNAEDIKILQRMIEFKDDKIELDFSDGTSPIEDIDKIDESDLYKGDEPFYDNSEGFNQRSKPI